jgi:protein-disulfide isomerase
MIKSLSAMALAAALLSTAPALAAEPKPLPAVTSADRILGRADAPVTVVEYASFTCSHCADWHNQILPEFKTRYIDTGKARLVFRDMPTQPTNVAASAAALGRCAAPGRFFDVAKALMSGQTAAFAARDLAPWFQAALAASGRTEAQIDTCLSDPATATALSADVQAAVDAGVTGTPTFFVNGRRVDGHSLQALSAVIDPLARGH